MLKAAPVGYKAALIIIQALSLLIGLPFVLPAQDQLSSNNRVAVVNGADISKAEFDAAQQQALHPWVAAGQAVGDARRRTLRKEALNNLIGRRLAYQESRRLGIQVDPAQVDREMAKAAARFSTAAAFEGALGRADLSRKQLRVQFQQDIAIRLLLEDQVLQQIEMDEREIRSFYDSHPNLFKTPALVKASHIFIAAGPDSTREERKKAVARLRAIQTKLDEGVAFAELALDYSQCPSSQNGGDLGYFDKGKMIKGFAEAAFALNPGEVSDIVRTGQGYHLILIEDRKPKTKLTFEQVREKLQQNLKIEKAAREIKAYLHSLRETAEIKIFLHL